MVAIFCKRLLGSRPLRINARKSIGDAGCVRDYVFVGDAARANVAGLEGRLQEGALNVATGQPLSTRDLATQLVLIAQPEVVHEYEVGGRRPGDVEYAVLDNTRFRLALGYPTPLVQGLKETYEWFRRALALESTPPKNALELGSGG